MPHEKILDDKKTEAVLQKRYESAYSRRSIGLGFVVLGVILCGLGFGDIFWFLIIAGVVIALYYHKNIKQIEQISTEIEQKKIKKGEKFG